MACFIVDVTVTVVCVFFPCVWTPLPTWIVPHGLDYSCKDYLCAVCIGFELHLQICHQVSFRSCFLFPRQLVCLPSVYFTCFLLVSSYLFLVCALPLRFLLLSAHSLLAFLTPFPSALSLCFSYPLSICSFPFPFSAHFSLMLYFVVSPALALVLPVPSVPSVSCVLR